MNTTDRRALDAMSARLGGDPMLVQGGGGNVSQKDGDVLWVKASGKWLSHAEREPMFAPVALSAVRKAIAACDADPVTPHVLPGTTLRPSIETTLHALLPHRIVVHVHSIHALAAAIRRDGESFAAARLGGLDWAWLPYARPGIALTQAIAALGPRYPAVLLLANHGLIVGADDCAGAERLIHDVEARLAVEARVAPPPDGTWLASAAVANAMELPADARVHDLATDAVNFRHASAGPLFPDQVVFLGPALATLELPHDAPYRAVLSRGVLVDPAITPGQEQMLLCLALLLPRMPADAPLAPLDRDELAALMGWEAEHYRKSLDAAQRR